MSGDDAVDDGDVSRETGRASEARDVRLPEAPPAPPQAGVVFAPDRLDLVRRYASALASAGVTRGLIGPRETPRLWDRHLLNSAVVAETIPAGSSVCDIGSGAGLPGIVLAIARPDLRVTLVEPLLRRTTFLAEVCDELGLTTTEVVRGRADVLHGSRTFDVVTSRAVAPLGRLLEWSMPLVAPAGALVAMKGRSAAVEIEEARPVLSALRCAEPEMLEVGHGVVDPLTAVVRVAWADPSRVGWPIEAETRSRRAPRRSKRPTAGRSHHGRS